ncbi:unnamed protein product [Soboliphyme baturini]|uniref:ceramidase n=1 Tax=Soboliphyme baturini TaxID=241478 RepID=A0A183J617_9BILA|nr:unnamed protein product [Soboliphyme baturini]
MVCTILKRHGEGVIITRSRTKVVDEQELHPTEKNGWYLLQTNTDSWKEPFYLDDRRTPGKQCMEKLGRENLSFTGILQVLSSPTTLNKLTIFTSIMDTDSGEIQTFIQKCPDPCWPW